MIKSLILSIITVTLVNASCTFIGTVLAYTVCRIGTQNADISIPNLVLMNAFILYILLFILCAGIMANHPENRQELRKGIIITAAHMFVATLILAAIACVVYYY